MNMKKILAEVKKKIKEFRKKKKKIFKKAKSRITAVYEQNSQRELKVNAMIKIESKNFTINLRFMFISIEILFISKNDE